jgi:hypothetical protein
LQHDTVKTLGGAPATLSRGGGKTNLLEAAGSAADRVRVHLMGDTCEVLRGLLLEELKPGRGHGRGCGREHMPESAFLRSARGAVRASGDGNESGTHVALGGAQANLGTVNHGWQLHCKGTARA